MVHSNYKHITDRLPDSLVKRAYQGLLNHSKNPVPLEMISGKSGRIESYLRYKLEVYENSLNKKRKSMAQEKLLRPRSWPECNVFPASPAIYVTDNGTQTVNITWPEALKQSFFSRFLCLISLLTFFLYFSSKKASVSLSSGNEVSTNGFS